MEHHGPRLGISCYRGCEGVAIVMSQCHAILTVHVLTKAGELVLDPMAGKGESGVSHSTPSHNSRIFKYIDIIYIYIDVFNGNESFNWWTSTCLSQYVPKNIKKKSQVPLRGLAAKTWRPGKALCCWKLRRFGLGANSWALSWINSSWHFDFERIWIRLDWMDSPSHTSQSLSIYNICRYVMACEHAFLPTV